MAHRSKWYQIGKEVGYDIASYIDLPEIGTDGVKNIDDAEDVFLENAAEAELNARQYADWAYGIGDEIERSRDPDIAYSNYEDGVYAGIGESWRERMKKFYSLTEERKKNPSKKRDVTVIHRVGVPAKRYISRPSQITRKTPSMRLKERRKKTLNAPAGYFPNPQKQAFLRYTVSGLNGGDVAEFYSLKAAKEYAQALAQKTGKSYCVVGR